MVDRSLGFSTDGEAGWKPMLVGGLLTFLTPCLLGVPAVFLAGYLVRVIRAADGDRETPKWNDVRGLFRDGARFLFATAAYLAVFAAVGTAVGAAVLVAVDLGLPGQMPGTFVNALAAFLLTIAVPVVLVTLPVAQVRFVLTDSVAGALNVQRVLKTSVTPTCSGTWLLLAVLWTVAWPFLLLLWVVLVGPFATFYVIVDSYYMFGQSVAAEMPVDDRGRERPTPRTARGEGRA